jgi:hypothetical protein
LLAPPPSQRVPEQHPVALALLLLRSCTQEDEILRKRIKSYGLNNWGMVADGLPGRSGKSCSERWRIYLTPGVKRPTQEPFNEYEVAVIYLVRTLRGSFSSSNSNSSNSSSGSSSNRSVSHGSC